jgi:fructokinase
MEAWVSGPALAADHTRITDKTISAEAVVGAAGRGDAEAQSSLARHQDRLARGLAHVVNIFDPEVIVLGGGLSKLAHLYEVLPALMRRHIFSDTPSITIRPPKWGDASGVRGAALLAGA